MTLIFFIAVLGTRLVIRSHSNITQWHRNVAFRSAVPATGAAGGRRAVHVHTKVDTFPHPPTHRRPPGRVHTPAFAFLIEELPVDMFRLTGGHTQEWAAVFAPLLLATCIIVWRARSLLEDLGGD